MRPGLPLRTVAAIARQYIELADRIRTGVQVDQAALDRWLRHTLTTEHHVYPEHVAIEAERVMEVVFRV